MTVAALLLWVMLRPVLVLACAAALVYGLRHRAAAARHAVWAGAIVALLLLPVLGAALPDVRMATVRRVAEVPAPAAATREAERTAGRGPAGGGAGLPTVLAEDGTGRSRAGVLPAAILGAWLLVALVLCAQRVRAEVHACRIVRRGRRAPDRIRGACDDIMRRSHGSRAVDVRMSDETAAPAVTGLGRAVVLLPADAIWWSDTDLNAVLVHELGHAARRDCALNFCGDMAAAFYWCNPLVRRAVRRMRLESERACDDLVLRADVDPGGYAQLLLSLARAAQPAHAFVAAATAIAHRSQLESRLLAVLDARVVRSPVPRRLTAALACAGALVAMPAAALTLAGVDAALQQLPTPEPDTLGDSIAHPSSERVPLDPAAYAIAPEVVNRLAMGPDSMLAAHLVQALAHVASHDGDLVRDRAAWALAQAAPDGRLVDPLLDALGDRDWRIQSYAAWALSIIDESRAVPRLVPLLEHPVWRLRAMAAHAIARSGHAHGRGVMHAALSDPAWQVRLAAVEFFSVTNDPDLENVLRPRLDDRHVAVRGAAARALRKP